MDFHREAELRGCLNGFLRHRVLSPAVERPAGVDRRRGVPRRQVRGLLVYLESGGSQSITRYRPNQRSSSVIIGCVLLILVSVPPPAKGPCRPATRNLEARVFTTSPAATHST